MKVGGTQSRFNNSGRLCASAISDRGFKSFGIAFLCSKEKLEISSATNMV